MTDLKSTPSLTFQNSWQFLSKYFFKSNDSWMAWLLLGGSIFSVLAITALGFVLGWWCFPLLFAAFVAKELTLLFIGIGAGLLIAGAMAGLHYLAQYLKNELHVNWRSWLTKEIVKQYLKNKTNYLEVSRLYEDLDNPEQRIQADIDKLVDSSLNLCIGFIENLSNLVTYSTLLWIIGGTLTVALFGVSFFIPGYLVWVAILAGGVTSLIGYLINKSLQQASNDEIKTSSNLRTDIQQLNNSPEEIAIEHAEDYHQSRIEHRIDILNEQTKKRLAIQSGASSFNLFNGIFQTIFPVFAAIPLYWMNIITMDAFYTSTYYVTMVAKAINWIIDSFETINKFKTSLERVLTLQNILDRNDNASSQNIKRQVSLNTNTLEIKNLNIQLHKNNEVLIKGLNLKFTPGVHTLIQAPSGTGKSSLFKAIAGTWLTGEGEIIIPNSLESIYFLPQKPTLPDDKLRNVLAYPDSKCNYSDADLIAALKAVNMEKLGIQLDANIGFKSLGEQQRIAFARVLLRKPNWVFLDEATASLDEATEAIIYTQIKKLLPNTTLISIAHRTTVKRYHDSLVFFKLKENKEVETIEEAIPHQLSVGA